MKLKDVVALCVSIATFIAIMIPSRIAMYDQRREFIKKRIEDACDRKVDAFSAHVKSIIQQNVGYASALKIMQHKYNISQWFSVHRILENYDTFNDDTIGVYMYIPNDKRIEFEKNVSAMYLRDITITELNPHNILKREPLSSERNFYAPCIISFPFDVSNNLIGVDYLFHPYINTSVIDAIAKNVIMSNRGYYSAALNTAVLNVVIPVLHNNVAIGVIIVTLGQNNLFPIFMGDMSFIYIVSDDNGDIIFGSDNSHKIYGPYTVNRTITFVNNKYHLSCAPTDEFIISVTMISSDMIIDVSFVMYCILSSLMLFRYILKNNIAIHNANFIRATNKFMSRVCRDIRYNLHQVNNIADIISEEISSADAYENYELIRMVCNNTIRIVSDILDFRKLRKGSFKIDHRHVSMRDVMGRIHDRYFKLLQMRDIEWSCICTMPDKKIIIDDIRIDQIIRSIIDTIVDKCTISFVSVSTSESDSIMTIMISNDSKREHITQAMLDGFSQDYTRLATSYKFGNLNIGIAMAKKLVELMGGTITSSSKRTHGFTFNICIPIRYSSNDARIDKTHQYADVNNNKSDHDIINNDVFLFDRALSRKNKNVSVLIVEHDIIDQTIMTKIFAVFKGMTISIANNGRDAIRSVAASEPKYDIIFINIQMPDIDSASVVQKIRDDHNGDNIVIIAMNTVITRHNLDILKTVRFDGVIHKPFTRKTINKLVRLIFPELFAYLYSPKKEDACQPALQLMSIVMETSNESSDKNGAHLKHTESPT